MISFKRQLSDLLNENSKENESNTPDFILANYLLKCLENFDATTKRRDEWYSVCLEPANSHFIMTKEKNIMKKNL